jgi:ATP-dependent helicase/nuclease subunit A
MTAGRIIPDDARSRQIEASDPAQSVWVAANAGSGKTHVLAQRVIRLLLQGCDPSRILCITFTKAAAANMQNRVFERLGEWIALDDEALDEAIRSISNETPDQALRDRARRLFALALETPGGLKVQTIHAFCTSLLHLFPFEANVAARFTVLDEASETQLLDKLTLEVLQSAAAAPDGPLGQSLASAIAAAADVTFRDLVRETIRRRDAMTSWIVSAGDVPEAIVQLAESLGIDPDDNDERIRADVVAGSLFKPTAWSAMAAALSTGTATDKQNAERFASMARFSDDERYDTLLEIFCTKQGKARERIVSPTIQASNPALYQRLLAEQQRICALLDRRRSIAALARSTALITIATEVIVRYRVEKDRRGLLDYNDLIDKAQALLETVSSAWVHYKLDRGIDHVLIDEAQDTSPKQWAIVRALVSEFFAGEGARGVKRTIFVVGDEKQSIFSFQGAAPFEFAAMRTHFEWAHQSAALDFKRTELQHSFRSGETVLGAVDAVFGRAEAYEGLTADPVATVHQTLPDASPGLVEIWDTEKPEDKKEIEGWDAPFDEVSETSPQVKLARRIARHVRLWQRLGRRPGDVLILVRRRGALFEAIIRALKSEGVAVAGADRLVLTEHIAVMDLIALGDALLLPDDDLALATVLKSPLFGLSEDELFTLAYDRRSSVRSVLRTQRPDISTRFDALAAAARSMTPFAFYAELLGAGGGRKAILARLGHEATDALDEFLNLALEYERNETPSLQGFLAWLRAARSEVKRDMEMARDEVRVMTVHGAKGLEAPIVILAESTTPPQGWHPPRLLGLEPVNAAPGTPRRIVWAGPKANDIPPMAAARETELSEARNEYRRLLYVAMTRAIERLIVCGTDGERKRPEGCWYDLVRDALEPHCVRERADDGAGEVLRYRKVPEIPSVLAAPPQPPTPEEPPDWLWRKVATEAPRAVAIKPSEFADEPALLESFHAAPARQYALLRGSIVHRLLQSLPDMVPPRRPEAARRYLDRQDPFTEFERISLAREVLALLDDPRFAPLFTPGSRAEVSIAGHIGGRFISGQVDRLVVTPQAVLIADFKTNRPAPATLDEATRRYPDYVTQLALYRAVLAQLYPNRPVRAALVWTDSLNLMEIPADALDAAVDAALTPA